MAEPSSTFAQPLAAAALRRRCEPASLGFATTAELAAGAPIVGQRRAAEADRLGGAMARHGYNLFVVGAAGLGRRTLVERLLRELPRPRPSCGDWCYVNNFAEPQRPRALGLPSGRGASLRKDMADWVAELKAAIPAAFESDEYRTRAGRLDAELQERQQRAFEEIGERAIKDGVALLRTPAGFSFAPLAGTEVMSPEAFAKLAPEAQRERAARVHHYEAELEEVVRRMAQWRRERFERLRALNREVVELAVTPITAELRARYADCAGVPEYVDAARADVIERADEFRKPTESAPGAGAMLAGAAAPAEADFRRYAVNVIVTDGEASAAPIVVEESPTYANLVGRVEHIAQFGALVTDFGLIRAGALHRANGGYLLVDALKLLAQPYAWEGLKTALRERRIRIESLGQAYSLISTLSLEPEPIALDTKVVLFGTRLVYYLLESADPEFPELFKVAAEFADDVGWTPESARELAGLVAAMVRERGLRPFAADAVAAVLEAAARRAEDAAKLALDMRALVALLETADDRAAHAGRATVAAADVEGALEAERDRAAQIPERLREATLRGIVMIDTAGAVVGQVNGLAVASLGRTQFGQPQRITATTRMGHGEVVDIQREVALGGAIHSKGVLTLAAFLAARYARSGGFALAAALTFEQHYGHVDGDSASVAELCALISSIASVPLRQDLAITGSINQLGEVQAIGGVNDKIEGFYDLCAARGLSGTQGVIVPAANAQHLMLRHDVVAAAAAGRFHVYAVRSADEALALLTGLDAERIDARVAERLQGWRAQAKARPEPTRSRAHGRERSGVR